MVILRLVQLEIMHILACCLYPPTSVIVFPVTVQCTKDGHFIVVVARDATLPKIDLESISLVHPDRGCGHVDSNSAFSIYHFPVTGCGTMVTVRPRSSLFFNQVRQL